jgi:hypothetical protein
MDLAPPKSTSDVDAFIERWSSGDGGQERANYALFLTELCDVLGAPRPDQASHDASANAYTFERAVVFRGPDGSKSPGPGEEQLEEPLVVAASREQKPLFPLGDVERTAAVFAALSDARGPLDAKTLAGSFRQGAKAEPAIARVLASLARLGHIYTADGRDYALRRRA